jgi:hypothetical protein
LLDERLDVVRRALGVDEHLPAYARWIDREVGKDAVVLFGRDVRDERATSRGDEEVEVPDLRPSSVLRELRDRGQLIDVVRADGRLHDEREAGVAEDAGALDGVPPGSGTRRNRSWRSESSASSDSDRPRTPSAFSKLARVGVTFTPFVPTTTHKPFPLA